MTLCGIDRCAEHASDANVAKVIATIRGETVEQHTEVVPNGRIAFSNVTRLLWACKPGDQVEVEMDRKEYRRSFYRVSLHVPPKSGVAARSKLATAISAVNGTNMKALAKLPSQNPTFNTTALKLHLSRLNNDHSQPNAHSTTQAATLSQ